MNEELLKRNEYLALENAILRSKIEGRIKFTDDERRRLAVLARDLGKKAMADIGPVVTLKTLMTWYDKLVAEKFDSSKNRDASGRPRVDSDIEDLVLQLHGKMTAGGMIVSLIFWVVRGCSDGNKIARTCLSLLKDECRTRHLFSIVVADSIFGRDTR